MKNIKNKDFKNIDEQIEYLISTKNILYNPKMAKILKERPYVSVINPYKKVFAKGYSALGHIYKNEVDFEQYMDLIAFDDHISKLLFEYIGTFERIFKQQIAYKISMRMFNNGDKKGISYVKYIEDYYLGDKHALKQIGFIELNKEYEYSGKLIESNYLMQVRERFIKEKIFNIGNLESLSSNNIVKYYQKNYNMVPFWLLVHAFSLGDLEIIFNMLEPEIRINIYKNIFKAEKIKNKSVNIFSNYLGTIRKIRNIINHYESIVIYIYIR